MSQTEPRPTSNVNFDVEITSGGRAYDEGLPKAEPRSVSPTRAAARERTRKRNLTIAALCAVGLAAIAFWAWLSNPNTGVPSDAVVRVNGEFIYEADITREVDLARATLDLMNGDKEDAPGRAKALEDLISRKMQFQDAQKAGVTHDPEEVESGLKSFMEQVSAGETELEETLSRYNLEVDDLRGLISESSVVFRYINDYVTQGATGNQEYQTKKNEWLTQLAQTSKVDRLKSASSGPAPRLGSEAPDFTLKDLAGKEVKLSSLRGRPVMINFWATWCPPCRAEIPTLVQTYADTRKGEASYEILGIATQSDQSTIQAFADELGINFPVLADTGNAVTDLYHVLPIPTSFFIDREGVIRQIHVGIVNRATMEKWLVE